jgi:hypothetical protein
MWWLYMGVAIADNTKQRFYSLSNVEWFESVSVVSRINLCCLIVDVIIRYTYTGHTLMKI